jgi:hypothetical protein
LTALILPFFFGLPAALLRFLVPPERFLQLPGIYEFIGKLNDSPEPPLRKRHNALPFPSTGWGRVVMNGVGMRWKADLTAQ